MQRKSIVGLVVGVLLYVLIAAALYMVFILVPTERVMGIVQRIFYFHVPLAWVGFLAFFIVFGCGIIYLITRSIKWDIAANASAEIGLVFCTLVLITGSIWARPIWNTWWTWDPRLTTTLVLWLIYLGYLMVRRSIDDVEKRAKISAVIGIAGFVDVPVVFLSISWWRSMHPVLVTQPRMGLAPQMLATLLVSLSAFTLLFGYLLRFRIKLGRDENAVAELSARIHEQKFEEV